MARMEAALLGAKEVGFTVLSISVSLVAVFIPLLFMEGQTGRLFREFAITLSAAVLISLVISLTTTPMMCAWFLALRRKAEAERFARAIFFHGGAVPRRIGVGPLEVGERSLGAVRHDETGRAPQSVVAEVAIRRRLDDEKKPGAARDVSVNFRGAGRVARDDGADVTGVRSVEPRLVAQVENGQIFIR